LRKAAKITTISAESRAFKRVLMVAGEASADLHGSNLVKEMRRLNPDLAFLGIGGSAMQRAGVEILFSSKEMAVVGLTEIFSKLNIILKASFKLKHILKNDSPDLLILIDYPGFNINLAKAASKHGIPVLYYISPQVWAWRKGRVKKIGNRITRMAVILPFEEPFYQKEGVNVDYVGHPLLDACPINFKEYSAQKELGNGSARIVVGLLPGSRTQEVESLLQTMVGAVEILKNTYPDMTCVLPLAPTIDPEIVRPFTEASEVSIEIAKGDIYKALGRCNVALVASGTATLDTAIMGVPMVVVYKVSLLTYWAAKMVVKVPHIGLVNLVAEKEIVPELIQNDVTPQKVAQELSRLIENKDLRDETIKNLKTVRQKLGGGGASKETAKIALEMME
jgi:lipid-A-disaccharide synthase